MSGKACSCLHAMHCHQRILNESNVILTIEKALFSKCKAWFEEGKTGDWQGMAVLGEGEGESERTQPGRRFEELV